MAPLLVKVCVSVIEVAMAAASDAVAVAASCETADSLLEDPAEELLHPANMEAAMTRTAALETCLIIFWLLS
jgi:hypothetical protein